MNDVNYDEDISKESKVDEEIDNNKLMAYDIAVFYNTYNLSVLMKWWGDKLIVPEFQRSYVWGIRKASEFVDSLLRGLPVPSMFFYDDTENNRMLVVDGQQRLKSLYSYIVDQTFLDKKFKLVGNIHPNWSGKAFCDLKPEDQDRLVDSLMNITVMRQLAPEDGQSSMYLAFQRINTGGISLNAQEIRMAVSYGPFAEYLYELAEQFPLNDRKFLRTQAQRSNNDYAPSQELILRFWTYYFSYPTFSGSSTRGMLDDFFSNQKDFDSPKRKKKEVKYISKQEFAEAYNAVIDVIAELTDDDLSPYTRPTKTYLESVWVGLAYRKLVLHKEIDVQMLPEILSNWKERIGDKRFSDLFQARRTSSVVSAHERIEAAIDYFSGDF